MDRELAYTKRAPTYMERAHTYKKALRYMKRSNIYAKETRYTKKALRCAKGH
jgi:hypothetical protein